MRLIKVFNHSFKRKFYGNRRKLLERALVFSYKLLNVVFIGFFKNAKKKTKKKFILIYILQKKFQYIY